MVIPYSIGAAFSNYDVLERSTGEIFHFVEGQNYHIETFAGAGGKKPLREEVKQGLAKQFNVNPDEIAHCKAIAYLDYYGEPVKADVHWFQVPGKKFKFYVKEWFFDED